jgi:hypothetical protein
MTDPIRTCACGCGTPVNNKWAKGHAARGEGGFKGPTGLRSLPGPDDPVWDDPDSTIDMGELVPDDPEPVTAPRAAPPADDDAPVIDAGPATVDPPPAHGKRQWRRQERAATPPKPGRVTATVRNDVQAKVSILLGVPGSVWQARDPLCGGEFMAGLPQTSAAFTAWICQSADLLAWFTGPGGNFMMILDILAALMPTASLVMAHHVYHSVEMAEGPPQPEQNYAA